MSLSASHPSFVLRYSDTPGEPRRWFQKMTGIGPMLTPSLDEAARFPTSDKAEETRFAMHPTMGVCFTIEPSKLVVDGVGTEGNVCVDCGGHGWVEDFATMSLAGHCKTCGGTGRVQADASRSITKVDC